MPRLGFLPTRRMGLYNTTQHSKTKTPPTENTKNHWRHGRLSTLKLMALTSFSGSRDGMCCTPVTSGARTAPVSSSSTRCGPFTVARTRAPDLRPCADVSAAVTGRRGPALPTILFVSRPGSRRGPPGGCKRKHQRRIPSFRTPSRQGAPPLPSRKCHTNHAYSDSPDMRLSWAWVPQSPVVLVTGSPPPSSLGWVLLCLCMGCPDGCIFLLCAVSCAVQCIFLVFVE